MSDNESTPSCGALSAVALLGGLAGGAALLGVAYALGWVAEKVENGVWGFAGEPLWPTDGADTPPPPTGPRYEPCDDPERLAAHGAEHGFGSVQVIVPDGGWVSTCCSDPDDFRAGMEKSWAHRYRLVHGEVAA